MKRMAIIGLGMIGGSLALALRKHNDDLNIIGIDTNKQSCEKAVARKIVDSCFQSIVELPASELSLDVIIIATPVSSCPTLAEQCYVHIDPKTTISDVGSTKHHIVQAFRHAYGTTPPQLVPAHPIAGSEQSGIDAASDNLFTDRLVILTPSEHTDSEHLKRIENMWKGLASNTIRLSLEYHDRVLAKTSHLPHLLSFALVHYLASESENYDIFRFAAGGFRDFTRIASSDPDMWSAIFTANSAELVRVIEGLQRTINDFKLAILADDQQVINRLLIDAKKARDYYLDSL